MVLRIFGEDILSFFWRPLYRATHLFGRHSKLLLKAPIWCCASFWNHYELLLKAPIWCYAYFWKTFWGSFEGPYIMLRIFLEAILSFFWRPLYGATHLFGSHSKLLLKAPIWCYASFGSDSKLLLKAPIWCYASFWKPFSASFQGPYMVLRIFLEAMLSFFWRPLYGATHVFEAIPSFFWRPLYGAAHIWCYASFWKPFSASFEGPYMVLRTQSKSSFGHQRSTLVLGLKGSPVRPAPKLCDV